MRRKVFVKDVKRKLHHSSLRIYKFHYFYHCLRVKTFLRVMVLAKNKKPWQCADGK